MKGWLCALFIAAVGHPLGNVIARLAVNGFSAHPLAYTCMVMISASLALLLFAKPGPLGIETLRRAETWGYGALQTFIYAIGVYVVLYVSGTEASVVMRIATSITFILSLVVVGQRTNYSEIIGFLLMTFGVFLMVSFAEISVNDKVVLVLLLLIRGFAQAGQKLIAEFHKTNRMAEGFRHTSRVTAFVVGVSSVILTIVFMSIGYIKETLDVTSLVGMPYLRDFFNAPALLIASIVGLFILSFSKYCEFYAAKKISAKYLSSIIALQPVFAIAYESMLASQDLVSLRTFQLKDYIAITLVMGGSIMIALSAIRIRKKDNGDWNDTLVDTLVTKSHQIMRLQEIGKVTLTFAKQDKNKASELLDIDTETLNHLLQLESGDFRMTSTLSEKIQEQFSKNVSSLDPLTGLINRIKFMSKFNRFLKEEDFINVLFIDLNKFKPVNDTYGHDAGDFILQGVAERLTALFPKRALVTRLGGDEFAILLLDKTKEQATEEIAKIKESIAKPFDFKGTKITIGGSVGIATYPEDGSDPEKLLKLADEGMYREKDAR